MPCWGWSRWGSSKRQGRRSRVAEGEGGGWYLVLQVEETLRCGTSFDTLQVKASMVEGEEEARVEQLRRFLAQREEEEGEVLTEDSPVVRRRRRDLERLVWARAIADMAGGGNKGQPQEQQLEACLEQVAVLLDGVDAAR